MPHIRSARTASCLAAMLHANHEHMGAAAVTMGAEALAFVCATEDFSTYRVRKKERGASGEAASSSGDEVDGEVGADDRVELTPCFFMRRLTLLSSA